MKQSCAPFEISKEYEVLSKNTNLTRLDARIRGEPYWMPVTAQQLSHRRATANLGELRIVSGATQIGLLTIEHLQPFLASQPLPFAAIAPAGFRYPFELRLAVGPSTSRTACERLISIRLLQFDWRKLPLSTPH
jgi:hypothetical protein